MESVGKKSPLTRKIPLYPPLRKGEVPLLQRRESTKNTEEPKLGDVVLAGAGDRGGGDEKSEARRIIQMA